jgi:hypothetical protein
LHPRLKGTKIDEEIQDLRAAVTQSKRIKESVVNFQTITLVLILNLNEVKLYKNKQIAEENKTKLLLRLLITLKTYLGKAKDTQAKIISRLTTSSSTTMHNKQLHKSRRSNNAC